MIKVLIVDDSAVIRKALTDELSKYEDIEVVGSAIDPFVARDKILKLHPDVLTLDMQMPRMNGLSFLAKLMKYYPLPVVVVSSVTADNSEMAIRALGAGAIEVIAKPSSQEPVAEMSKKLIHAIRAASQAKIIPHLEPESLRQENAIEMPRVEFSNKLIAIGASTGGTIAIEEILRDFPENAPGTVVVQHMPVGFTASFAERLNSICKIKVREAADNDEIKSGLALVAPGNKHMLIQRSANDNYRVRVKDGPQVHHQRPSVDVLFDSVANVAAGNAIGVLLTGMGSDGATGLLAMRQSGAYTMAQDEATSIVFGMPKEAIKLGAANKIVPLPSMAREIINALRANNKRGQA